jgi:hypothetical protein
MAPDEIDLIGMGILIREAESGCDLARQLVLALSKRVHAMAAKIEKLQHAKKNFYRAAQPGFTLIE